MGGMMAYGIQLPKLSGNRAVAASIANDLVERMRANIPAYTSGSYNTALNYDESTTIPNATTGICSYPNCSSGQLAVMDLAITKRQLRLQLPAGGFSVENAANGEGRVYVLWQEPGSAGTFATGASDICPSSASSFTNPQPRCVMVPFKL